MACEIEARETGRIDDSNRLHLDISNATNRAANTRRHAVCRHANCDPKHRSRVLADLGSGPIDRT